MNQIGEKPKMLA